MFLTILVKCDKCRRWFCPGIVGPQELYGALKLDSNSLETLLTQYI